MCNINDIMINFCNARINLKEPCPGAVEIHNGFIHYRSIDLKFLTLPFLFCTPKINREFFTL